MRVEFSRHEKKGRLACSWVATRAKRTRVPGSYMAAGRDLPHDLAQYVVEAATNTRHGFWGLVDSGATFKSTGRKATKPGRAVIAAHRAELDEAEVVAGIHDALWKAGETSPVTAALDTALEQWRALRPGEVLVYEWPAAHGVIVPADAANPATTRS